MEVLNCPHCERHYKRKINYDKHIHGCKLLMMTKKERYYENEKKCDTPNIRELYEMIIILSKKNEILERKVEELQKINAIKKKRINIIEWLNNNNPNISLYCQFSSKQEIFEEELEYVWECGYIDGISKILQRWFKDKELLPIKAFDQKENTFYIKTIDGWIIMTPELFNNEISRINKQLMQYFVKWQQENVHRISNEDYMDEYTNKFQKIMGSNYTRDQINYKITKNIYKYLKINIKNITNIEYSL